MVILWGWALKLPAAAPAAAPTTAGKAASAAAGTAGTGRAGTGVGVRTGTDDGVIDVGNHIAGDDAVEEGRSADAIGEGGAFGDGGFVVLVEFGGPRFFDAEEASPREQLFVEVDKTGGGNVGALDGLQEGKAFVLGEFNVLFEAVEVASHGDAFFGIAAVG